MNTGPTPNIAIKSNICVAWDHPPEDAIPYFLQADLPGDLLAEILKTRDVRILRRELTRKQMREYEQCRFFQHHGQWGITFEEL